MGQRFPTVIYCPTCAEQLDSDATEAARSTAWYQQACWNCGTRFGIMRADALAYEQRDIPRATAST